MLIPKRNQLSISSIQRLKTKGDLMLVFKKKYSTLMISIHQHKIVELIFSANISTQAWKIFSCVLSNLLQSQMWQTNKPGIHVNFMPENGSDIELLLLTCTLITLLKANKYRETWHFKVRINIWKGKILTPVYLLYFRNGLSFLISNTYSRALWC